MPAMHALIFLFGMLMVVGCSTAPRTFQPNESISPDQFSYHGFDAALQAHVTDGVVDYPGMAQDDRFERHLRQLDRIDPNQLRTRNDRLAFWINAYNAFAIQGILDGYSPKTLWGRYRYFIARKYPVGGQTINLYDLEQKLLIPDYHEPRIHFAIVCASQSCPKLQSRAYAPAALDEQLETGARGFINDPARNRFDHDKKIAYLSMIFKWFEDDFAAQAGSLLDYVRRYVIDPELADDLARRLYRVEFLDYDWSLNGIDHVDQG